MEFLGLDEKDNAIVNLLMEDARMSWSDIGDKVGLSRVAVKNRVKALEDKGIIKGYKAIVDPMSTPQSTVFIMNVETTPEGFEDVKQMLTNEKSIVTLVQTTGSCRLVAVCVAKDAQTMKNFVNRMYKTCVGAKYINVSTVLDTLKGTITPNV